MFTRLAVLATSLFLLLPAAFSADKKDDKEPPPPERPVFEEEILVPAKAPDEDVVPARELETGVGENLAVSLLELPGVQGVRRSQSAVEPVIRGLGWERVQTEVNGLPMYSACPARMDPPATMFGVAAMQEVKLMKGLPSVTEGPGGSGGRLELSTDFDRGPEAGREMSPWIQSVYDGARSGYTAGAGVNGGTESLDYAIGVETVDMGDYDTPDGREVLSGQDETGAFASLGWRQNDTGRWNVSHLLRDGGRVDFPALPMDTEQADVSVTHAGYRFTPRESNKRFLGLEVEAASGTTDHLMSNRWKPNRMMMEASTASQADTVSGSVATDWWIGQDARLKAGVDWFQLDRDALRTRTMVISGMSFRDHLWPDVSQDDLGLYVEFTATPSERLTVRAGVRHDQVSSSAAAADDPGIATGTIRENYVRFYGAAAGITDRDEHLFSGNVQAVVKGPEGWSFHAGAGQVSRAAGMTERYFSFAPSPGGFSVGNPALDAEVKRELSAGFRYAGSRISGGVTVYHDSVADYIKPTVLEDGINDWNMDGNPDRVSGFRNVDADLTGGELVGVIQASESFTVPVSIAWVRGEYDGTPLPEIPPLEAKLAVRYSFAEQRNGRVELAARIVARQDRVDPDFAAPVPPTFRENETPGYGILKLRAGIRLFGQLALEGGIENLTDKLYHDHLAREVLMPSGGLTPGSEMIQPGRSFYARARMTF